MAKKKKLTKEDDELLAELGIEVAAKKITAYTALEQRIISGFEEIQKFVDENGSSPEFGEDKEIFERLYAVRLERIKSLEVSYSLLSDIDYQNHLKTNNSNVDNQIDNLDDEQLLEQLGINDSDENSIENLKHVKTRAEKRAAEDIANRTICENFDDYKELFKLVKDEIDSGYRQTIRFRKDAGFTKTSIRQNEFYIVGGQLSYIENIGESFKAPNGEEDARMRVIYSNGTESNILKRSLIRAMYKDESSRFVTSPNLGPLFSGESSIDDKESGTIYVLRSHSDHPLIVENREVIHKIGVTKGEVKKRISNAKNEATYLLADVEIVATYKLANINRNKLESIIQRFFSSVNLDIELKDRFGKPVKSTEWYLVPIFVIDEVVERIKDGTIENYIYDSKNAKLKNA